MQVRWPLASRQEPLSDIYEIQTRVGYVWEPVQDKMMPESKAKVTGAGQVRGAREWQCRGFGA